MGFFKSFFSGKKDDPESDKQKSTQKNFEIFKYDGMRAQRMGRPDYAIKCFTEALNLQDDFETMSYLAQVYIQTNQLTEARHILEDMSHKEKEHVTTFLTLANVCYMLEDYPAMVQAAQQAIRIEEGNAMAHYLLGKALYGQGDGIMSIAHLTKAIVLKDDFTEARLLRAEVLNKMQQPKEAMEDIETVLTRNPNEENALLLRGNIQEEMGNLTEAETDYQHVIEVNPFQESAFLYLGKLYIRQDKLTEAIAVFDEAVDLNPNFAQAYHERGRAKLLNGDKNGSLEDIKKALELNPKDVETLNGQFNNQPLNRQTDILGL
ncbi:tetratricopeptide repeat protein [gut metagenome]|uniref:Tetratricopeptide repeat protein n=1 Tax=gut metagenome TaxID=749906 RepID=J9FAN4_9ZZZZ